MNAKALSTHLSRLAGGLLLLLILSACATASAAELPPLPSPAPDATESRAHTPQIVRGVERESVEDGVRYFYKDVYFRDAQGDATRLVNKLVGTDPEGGIFLHLDDDVITAPASQQAQEALVSTRYGCPGSSVDPFDFTVEDRVLDAAGSFSEPVIFTIACPAASVPDLLPFTTGGLIVGLGLVLAVGLYLRARPSQGQPLLLSAVLLLSTLMTVGFAQMVLHEGGHALMDLPSLAGRDMRLYVHPFMFSGYSRPMYEWNNTLAHAAGAIVGMLGALLISIPFWKRRSVPLLAVVMLLPWAVIGNGGYIASLEGDFHNILQLTGLPPALFISVGVALAALGVLMLFTLLPLFGLAPGDKRALLVIPAALFAWGVLSRVVAILFVPGSPFARRWHLANEILLSTNAYVALVLFGLLAALLYVTLYRWLEPRLPAWLRSEPVAPSWQGIEIPGLLGAASFVIGMVVVLT